MVEINKQLVVKGHLQKLSVDPFSSFPFINIQLQNLRIEESTQHFQKDLLGLESLQLTFHPVKIFRGKWEVEKIRISNGQIRIFKGAKNNNFQIIRPYKKNTSNDQNPFWSCKLLELNNIEVLFEDDKASQAHLFLTKSKVKIALDSIWSFNQKSEMVVRKWQNKGEKLPKNLHIKLLGDLRIHQRDKKGYLQKMQLNLNHAGDLSLKGDFSWTESSNKWQVEYASEQISPSILLYSLAADSKIPTKNILGYLKVQGRAHGEDGRIRTSTEIYGNNSSFSYKNRRFSLVKFGANHQFKNGQHQLNLALKQLKNQQNQLSGELSYAQNKIRLKNIKGSVQSAFLTSMGLEIPGESNLLIHFDAHGDIQNNQGKWLPQNNLVAHANIKGDYKEMNRGVNFENFDVQLNLQNKRTQLQCQKGLLNKSPVEAKINVEYRVNQNTWAYTGQISLDFLKMDELYKSFKKKRQKPLKGASPEIEGGLILNIDEFSFDNFVATDVQGKFFHNKQNWYWSNLAFQSCDGQILCNGGYANEQLQSKLDLNQVDIQKLFKSMDEFGQSEIGSKNLMGMADIKLDFSAKIDSSGFVLPSIKAKAQLKIQDGRLYKYKTLQEISKLLDVNSLSDVRFKTLENTLEIKDQQIIFPPTLIRNDLVNLEISGRHSFDNEIDYKVELDIGSYLVNKSVFFKKRRDRGIESTANSSKVSLKVNGNALNPNIKVVKKPRGNKAKRTDESSLFDE